MVEEEHFVFNDISSLDLDIVIQDEDMPPVKLADDDKELVTVLGRDGFLTISNNRKKPFTKSIKCTLLNEENKHQARNWLQGVGRLIVSNDPDVYFNSTIISKPDFFYHWSGGWEFTVSFECQPYGYLISGENKLTITNNNTTIFNNFEESNPYLKIYGTGAVELNINSDKIILDIDQYVEIDSELMESWKGTVNKPFVGKFPTFKSGENIINWNGNVSKIEVVPRWRR